MGVNLRRRNAVVSQQLLHIADVQPGFQPLRGAGVAQHMGGDFAGQAGVFTQFFQKLADVVGGERQALRGEKQEGGCLAVAQPAFQVGAQAVLQLWGEQIDKALAVAFAVDADAGVFDKQIVQSDGAQFAYAKAGFQQQQDGGFQAGVRKAVGRGNAFGQGFQQMGVATIQCARQAAGKFDFFVQFVEWVECQDVLLDGPFEQ